VIRQTRRFVLECYACEKICKDPTKQFCPSCGNPTLKKLSVRANEDGTMTFFRNPKRRINNRGKIVREIFNESLWLILTVVFNSFERRWKKK